MMRDRIRRTKYIRCLWSSGDLRGLGLYLLNSGNKALSVDFVHHIKGRTIGDAPDPLEIAEMLCPVVMNLLTSAYERYVVVALGALQRMLGEVGPECAQSLGTTEREPCATTTERYVRRRRIEIPDRSFAFELTFRNDSYSCLRFLRVCAFVSELCDVKVSLETMLKRNPSPPVANRCDSILRRIDAIWNQRRR